jgi:hypothetical protein
MSAMVGSAVVGAAFKAGILSVPMFTLLFAKIYIILGIIQSFYAGERVFLQAETDNERVLYMNRKQNTTYRERPLHEKLVIAFIGATIVFIILKVVFL